VAGLGPARLRAAAEPRVEASRRNMATRGMPTWALFPQIFHAIASCAKDERIRYQYSFFVSVFQQSIPWSPWIWIRLGAVHGIGIGRRAGRTPSLRCNIDGASVDAVSRAVE
jgi:hypothetical protein